MLEFGYGTPPQVILWNYNFEWELDQFALLFLQFSLYGAYSFCVIKWQLETFEKAKSSRQEK